MQADDYRGVFSGNHVVCCECCIVKLSLCKFTVMHLFLLINNAYGCQISCAYCK